MREFNKVGAFVAVIVLGLTGCGSGRAERPVRSVADGRASPSPALANPEAVAACRAANDAMPRIGGTVVGAFNSTLGSSLARRDRHWAALATLAGMPTFALPTDQALTRAKPDTPVVVCYIDGSFDIPTPPGAVVPDRSMMVVLDGVTYQIDNGPSRAEGRAPEFLVEDPDHG